VDNKNFLSKGKLAMPVLALGGEKSFGKTMAEVMRFAASNVQEGVVPDSGHWVMEENPNATITMIRAFLMAGEEAAGFFPLLCGALAARSETRYTHRESQFFGCSPKQTTRAKIGISVATPFKIETPSEHANNGDFP